MFKTKLIYIHNFVLGFGIMSIEMLASRYLSPFFGSSSIIWANIIGVAMLAIAIGYYFGGKLADRNPSARYYFSLSIMAAIATIILPLVLRFLLPNSTILQLPLSEIFLSFVVSVFVFGIPIGLLSLAGPFAIKLITTDQNHDHIGRIAGLLSACNTVGGILGIYLTTFTLVPYIGVNPTIWLNSVLVFLSATIGLLSTTKNTGSKIKGLLASLVIINTLIAITSYSLNALSSSTSKNLIYSFESTYQQINVYKDNFNNSKYLVFDAANNYQTKYNPDSVILDNYADNYGLLTGVNTLQSKPKQDILILGYAGGAIGKTLHRFKNVEIEIDGVEIDPEVTRISKEYFGVKDEERNIFQSDARTFINNTSKKYDIIIIDAFSNLFIPYHLMSVEFFEQVRESLNPGGVLAINTIVEDPGSELFIKMGNTINQSFGILKYYTSPSGNTAFIGSSEQFNFIPNQKFPQYRYDNFVNGLKTFSSSDNSKLFTDDRSDLHNLMNDNYYTNLVNK